MKLSKKNKALLRGIRRALSSGKAVGGLLAGLAAAAVGCGCQRGHGPHDVMGSYPNADPDRNVRSERWGAHVMGKYLVEPEEERQRGAPKPKPEPFCEPQVK